MKPTSLPPATVATVAILPAQIGPQSVFSVSDCEFTHLGGSGIVGRGGGSVSVVHSFFAGLCNQCCDHSTGPASLVTIHCTAYEHLRPHTESETVSFPICVHSVDMVFQM
jgi:hypothetical protein